MNLWKMTSTAERVYYVSFRATLAIALLFAVAIPGECGDSLRRRVVEETVRNVVELQNADGSWGRFPKASPELRRQLMLETTALTSLALSAASDDKVERGSMPALSQSVGYLWTHCRSFARQRQLTKADERVFAIAAMSLCEIRNGREIDQAEDVDMSQLDYRIGELLQDRMQGDVSDATAWYCIYLDTASRGSSSKAIAAIESAKRTFVASSPKFGRDTPSAFLVRALLSGDRGKLISEATANQKRMDWITTFDDAVFCSIAIDRISCFHELRDPGHVTPLIAVNQEGKPLTSRPVWVSWHKTLETLAIRGSERLIGPEMGRDTDRGIEPEWSDVRSRVKQCLLCELYYRRMQVNIPAEE